MGQSRDVGSRTSSVFSEELKGIACLERGHPKQLHCDRKTSVAVHCIEEGAAVWLMADALRIRALALRAHTAFKRCLTLRHRIVLLFFNMNTMIHFNVFSFIRSLDILIFIDKKDFFSSVNCNNNIEVSHNHQVVGL